MRALTAILLIFVASPVWAADYSLFDGACTFSAPSIWKAFPTKRSDNESIGFEIPYARTDGTPDAANVIVKVWPNKSSIDVEGLAQWEDNKIIGAKGTAVLGASIEDKQWITLFMEANETAIPYALIDRFGATKDYLISVRIAIPVYPNGGAADIRWLEEMFENTNKLIASIILSKQSESKSRIEMRDGAAYLVSYPDGGMPISPFPLEPAGLVIDPSKLKK